MRLGLALLAASAALATAGAASAASVELRDAVVRVTVIPEDRADVKVEFTRTNPKLPLQVSNVGGLTIVDGGLAHRIRDCHHKTDHNVYVRGVGEVRAEDMPQVVIRTPRAIALSANGAAFGAIGRSASLDLRDSGCSSWTVADVAGDLRVQESGAGSIQMGASERLDVRLSGAANIRAVRVRQGLQAQLSGAGNVEVQDVSGPVQAHVSGVGRVRLGTGHVTVMNASVSGIGGIDFNGTVDNLDAGISGLGSVRVKQVTGSVTKHVSGAGHITIG